MPELPPHPKIYHIVHLDRVASIIADGFLWSDSIVGQRERAGTTIGMEAIKKQRLRLPVTPHDGTFVGDFVPFYFCPRSVMLYVIHRANDPELSYRGGQEPIIHLEADLHKVATWADEAKRKWAFSLSNAGGADAQFRSSLAQLDEVNWAAVTANDFRQANIKEGKQAEFLVHESFPWEFVENIGVISDAVSLQVANATRAAGHQPKIEVRGDWYY